MRVQKGLIGFIIILQAVLFLAHFIVYETWAFSPAGSDLPGTLWIKLVLGFLSVSFIAASLLAFRYTDGAVRAFYRIAAVWLGFLSFLFFAAIFSWIIFGGGAAGWSERELPSDGGMAVRRCSRGWPLRSFQRKPDANHSNDGTTRKPAAGVARAEGGAHQRPAPGACAKRQFSAADGCQDFEGRAARDFYCRRLV
jgi:hypothetical protein